MSLDIPHTLYVEAPSDEYSGVADTQSLKILRSDGTIDVIFYFQLNTAMEVVGSRITTGMGKTKFRLITESESGAVCASNTLRKVRFNMPDGVGIGDNIELIP